MTEIPEHLLKRAAERRAATAGKDASADASAAAPAAEGAPAAAGSAAPAKAEAKPPAPLPTLEPEPVKAAPELAVVAAAKNRKRVPYWAASLLALLPLWAFIYLFAIRVPPAGESDPLVIGHEVYVANCQSCHQADGSGADGGGTGQRLNEGHTLETFKDPLSMIHWIAYGAEGGARPDGTYGDLDRPGGPVNINTLSGAMPGFGTGLTAEEYAAVVIYIREEFGGELYDPENEQGFTVEAFEADAGAVEAEVEATIALGDGGDPDVASIERAAP